MNLSIEPIHKSHLRKNFRCGKDLLDNYLHHQARQDVRKKLATCFVLIDDKRVVNGYYTLSAASIDKRWLPEEMVRRIPPSYHDLPVTLLGRLAVDQSISGQGFGAHLPMDALFRTFNASRDQIGSMAVVVDPLDADAKAFYQGFGFILLPDSGKMFLPMVTIGKLFVER